MSDPKVRQRPVAVWFLYSEDNQPLGQLYRSQGEEMPVVGARLSDGERWKTADVLAFEEIRSVCEMRRFRVIIRVLD